MTTNPTPAVIAPYPGRPALAAAPVGAPPAGGLNVWALLRALKARWFLALCVGTLLGAGAAVAVWFLLPPAKPTASAKLIMPDNMKQGVMFDHPDAPMARATQVALLKSRMVLTAALRDPEIARLGVLKRIEADGNDPIEWLEKNLNVVCPHGSEIITVALAGDDGDDVRRLVDAIVGAYLRDVVAEARNLRAARIKDLENYHEKWQQMLRFNRTSLHEKLKKAGTTNDPVVQQLKQEAATQHLATMKKELTDLQMAQKRLTMEEELFKARKPHEKIDPEIVRAHVEQHERVAPLVKKVRGLESEMVEVKDRYREGEKSVQYQTKHQELTRALKELETLRKELPPQVEQSIRDAMKNDHANRLAVIQQSVQINKQVEEWLTKEITDLSGKTAEQLQQYFDSTADEAEIKNLQDTCNQIFAALTKLRFEREAPDRVKKFEDAIVAPVDEKARKVKYAGMALLGAFGAALALVAFLEYLQRRVDGADAVQQGLGLRVLGTIPAPPSRMSRMMGDGGQWQRMLSEYVDAARTMLIHLARQTQARVILVTSAAGGEGKTSLSTHLALSLARSGHRTLLIDGDLRNPNANRLFDVPLTPGFCEVLRGEVPAADSLRQTVVPGMWVLAAGELDSSVMQAVAQGEARRVFDQLKQEFDYVVIDSSPVLPVTDAMLLAQHVDGVVLSLLQGISRLPRTEMAQKRLTDLGVNVFGAVVNGTVERMESSYDRRYLAAAKA